MKRNPPWADKVLKTAYERLQTVVDAKRLPISKGKGQFEEFGAGHYGVVYPTREKNVVCKITTDASEAAFVRAAISLKEFPSGIVGYYDVVRIEGQSHRQRPVFALWRSEVQPVTIYSRYSHHKYDTFTNGVVELLTLAKLSAHTIREYLKKQSPEKRKNTIAQMEKRSGDFTGSFDINKTSRPRGYDSSAIKDFQTFIKYKRGIDRAVACADLFWEACDWMNYTYGFNPGRALQWYYREGLLLADVHGQNVSLQLADPKYPDDEEWVISDPGHAIALTDKFADLTIKTV
jgi:hypothetical protein